MRYAVIQNGQVVNVVQWDGQAEWSPGDHYTVIDCPDEVAPGWTWDSEDGFTAPVPVEDPS